ncbi:MAG: hypothetical protein KDC80_15185 [Saprospiraceae bacterium]|nr:hypothetical protein [Saprospiraceae bacterium]
MHKMSSSSLFRYLPLFLISVTLSCQPQAEKAPVKTPGWERLGPGGGGSTFKPTFSYHSDSEFILRCDMTGAYLTRDGGQSFSQINFPNGSSSFAYDPHDSLKIYIGSQTLHRSTDGGKNWQMIFPPEGSDFSRDFMGDHADFQAASPAYPEERHGSISHIQIDPEKAEVIYFVLDHYLFHSLDNGQSWHHQDLSDDISYLFIPAGSPDIFAFSESKIYRISKSDGSITSLDLPAEVIPAFSFAAGQAANGAMRIYTLHNDPSLRSDGGVAPTALWISEDKGTTWKKSNHPLILNAGGSPPTFAVVRTSEFQPEQAYLVVSDYPETDHSGQIAHWYGALHTNDGGETWTWVWKGGGGSGQYAVKDGVDAGNLEDGWVNQAFGGEYIRLIEAGVSPTDGQTAIVTDWYRTMLTRDGGAHWSSVYSEETAEGAYISTGLDVTTTYGVHFDPFDSNHLAISYTDIGYHHSFDGGKSWIRSTTGIPPEWHNTCYWVVFDPQVKDRLWSVWSGLHDFPRGKMTRNPAWKENGRGGVAVSTDGGRTWTPQTNGIGDHAPSTCIVLDPDAPRDARILYVSVYGKGVYKSTDGGKKWTQKNNGLTGSMAAFEITLASDGALYLITSPTPQHRHGETGREVWMGAVYKSTDGAGQWQRLPVSDEIQFPNGLAYDPDDPERLYLASWSDITLGDMIGGRIARSTGGDEVLELQGGIARSEDGGQTWTNIFDPGHYVYDVTVDPDHPATIYCNTFDQGAYQSDDYGATWKKLKGYDFHWGHRVITDPYHPGKVYLTTFGSSVWHGNAVSE